MKGGEEGIMLGVLREEIEMSANNLRIAVVGDGTPQLVSRSLVASTTFGLARDGG
jgi:hypothetical protein